MNSKHIAFNCKDDNYLAVTKTKSFLAQLYNPIPTARLKPQLTMQQSNSVVNLDEYITLVGDTKISVFWYNPAQRPDSASDEDYDILGGKLIRLSSD